MMIASDTWRGEESRLDQTYADGAELTRRLRGLVLETLAGLSLSGRRVALLDFPNHPNVGDSAIWMGELAALGELRNRIVHVCDALSLRPALIREALGPDGVILLHGGGNFGTLYEHHQDFREEVLAEFRDTRIVQLPQTVWFGPGPSLDRIKRLIASHNRFTLLVRDRSSLEFAQVNFEADVRLCPDMAFVLAPHRCSDTERPSAEKTDILVLGRTDRESSTDWSGVETSAAGSLRLARVDWRSAPWGPSTMASKADPAEKLALHAKKVLERIYRHSPVLATTANAQLAKQWNALAAARVRHGLALLCSARVLVTDRLHAHLLALSLGIPQVVLDNRYGKVRGVSETWGTRVGNVRFAASAAEAIAAAAELVHTEAARGLDAGEKRRPYG